MKALLFCAASSDARPASSYLEQKLARFADGTRAGQSSIEVVDASTALANLKSAQAPEIVAAKIGDGKACVLQQLAPRFFLDDNEEIVADTFAYLGEKWQGLAANTVVLKRETNRATFLVVLPDVCVDVLREGDEEFLSIVDSGRPLYPIPPPRPVDLVDRARAGVEAGSTLTELKATSSTRIKFGWRLPQAPDKDWWALYPGVMPGWKNLDQYNDWNYICLKGEKQPKSGTRTVDVKAMVSGAIYTFALFQWKWNVMDYQEFHAP